MDNDQDSLRLTWGCGGRVDVSNFSESIGSVKAYGMSSDKMRDKLIARVGFTLGVSLVEVRRRRRETKGK